MDYDTTADPHEDVVHLGIGHVDQHNKAYVFQMLHIRRTMRSENEAMCGAADDKAGIATDAKKAWSYKHKMVSSMHYFEVTALQTMVFEDEEGTPKLQLCLSWSIRLCNVSFTSVWRSCSSMFGISTKELGGLGTSQLRQFLVFTSFPRSLKDDAINYRIAIRHRRSMSFWVPRRYAKRPQDKIRATWSLRAFRETRLELYTEKNSGLIVS
ncbi:hypothetical protein FLONG3_6332 [Fusarium longipes]|uniref:Uncharacterized protein n=1 Tax=Fusarium longipes TaxID=694270 RepID=A0A395SNG0_9HYPO|nr:hypothetical protein FLONG3_6332 [Fusarium longipes]